MIRNIKTILCIVVAIITTMACQQEEMEDTQQQEKEKVSFIIAPNLEIQTGTDYVPMGGTRSGSKKVNITNQYNYVIAKRIDNDRLIVEEVGKAKIDRTKAETVAIPIGEDGQEYINLIVELRPGEYEIYMFTGDTNITWNTEIKKGDILDETGKPVKAIEYKPISFWSVGKESKSIKEEIFYAREKIMVEKTTDLHTPNPNTFKLGLERRVSKFRILLNNMKTPTGKNFQSIVDTGNQWSIHMTIKRTGGKKFASGLDIWGNLWYDDDKDMEEFPYATVTMMNLVTSSSTPPGEYFMSTRPSLLYAPYILADLKEEYIEIETVKVECKSQESMSGAITSVSEDKLTFKLKNNTIDGYSLKLTDSKNGDGDYILEPVMENVAELFEGNYEFTY